MKLFALFASFSFIANCAAAVSLSVGFSDSSKIPSISDSGGSFPAPADVPIVSNLSVNAPNTTHPGTILGQALWMDSYSRGDYFSFFLIGQPGEQIQLTGIWYQILAGASTGPNAGVHVDLVSHLIPPAILGGVPNSVILDLARANAFPVGHEEVGFGNFGLEFPDAISSSPLVEIRFTGHTGNQDTGLGPHESFGVGFISASFEVVPEPSASSMFILISALASLRRKRMKM